MQPWGIGSLSRIPTDDGRCLWIADSVVLANGMAARNVALESDPNAPFGSCPQASLITPIPMVTIEGGDDPSILVQVDGGYRLGGSTRVVYRLFRVDPTAVYGVTEMGGGVARLDSATGLVVIPSPATPFPWGLDLDLGDAMLPFGDGSHELVWGCPPNGTLNEGCKLARLDVNDAVKLLSKSDWIASIRGSDGMTLFDSGRWVSAIVPVPGALEHLYVADFTRSILRQTSTAPEGPWSGEANAAACNLPAADPTPCAPPSSSTRPGRSDAPGRGSRDLRGRQHRRTHERSGRLLAAPRVASVIGGHRIAPAMPSSGQAFLIASKKGVRRWVTHSAA